MDWMPDWGWSIVRDVVAGAVILVAGLWIGATAARKRERAAAAAAATEWTLEHVVDGRWTLRRDAAKTALATRVWSDEDIHLGNRGLEVVRFGGVGSETPDIPKGERREIVNLPPGRTVWFAWIESDRRYAAEVLTRASEPIARITAADVGRDPLPFW